MERRQFCRMSATVLGAAAMSGIGRAADGLAAIGSSGREVFLTAANVAELRAGLHGSLLLAGDAGYDAARKLWNGAFDRRPALIARCADSADVARCVSFARTY